MWEPSRVQRVGGEIRSTLVAGVGVGVDHFGGHTLAPPNAQIGARSHVDLMPFEARTIHPNDHVMLIDVSAMPLADQATARADDRDKCVAGDERSQRGKLFGP